MSQGRCQHDLAERETACADGMCPLCLAEKLAERDAECAGMREALTGLRNEARAFQSVAYDPGVTNHRCLMRRIEEATAALASGAGKQLLERLEKAEANLLSEEHGRRAYERGFAMGDRERDKAVAQARAQALEEAAKVAESHRDFAPDIEPAWNAAAIRIGAAIRALSKSTPTDGEK